jgi:hypothetical protein
MQEKEQVLKEHFFSNYRCWEGSLRAMFCLLESASHKNRELGLSDVTDSHSQLISKFLEYHSFTDSEISKEVFFSSIQEIYGFLSEPAVFVDVAESPFTFFTSEEYFGLLTEAGKMLVLFNLAFWQKVFLLIRDGEHELKVAYLLQVNSYAQDFYSPSVSSFCYRKSMLKQIGKLFAGGPHGFGQERGYEEKLYGFSSGDRCVGDGGAPEIHVPLVSGGGALGMGSSSDEGEGLCIVGILDKFLHCIKPMKDRGEEVELIDNFRQKVCKFMGHLKTLQLECANLVVPKGIVWLGFKEITKNIILLPISAGHLLRE